MIGRPRLCRVAGLGHRPTSCPPAAGFSTESQHTPDHKQTAAELGISVNTVQEHISNSIVLHLNDVGFLLCLNFSCLIIFMIYANNWAKNKQKN
jgi:hypothetical protein